MLKTWFRCTFSVSSFRVFKKWHDVIRPRSLAPSTLFWANYAFFAQHLLTSKLLSHAFPKSPILCKDKLVEGTKLLGLVSPCHFLKTRKFETENVHPNQVFSIRLVTFSLHFKCIGLQTLGGLYVKWVSTATKRLNSDENYSYVFDFQQPTGMSRSTSSKKHQTEWLCCCYLSL